MFSGLLTLPPLTHEVLDQVQILGLVSEEVVGLAQGPGFVVFLDEVGLGALSDEEGVGLHLSFEYQEMLFMVESVMEGSFVKVYFDGAEVVLDVKSELREVYCLPFLNTSPKM